MKVEREKLGVNATQPHGASLINSDQISKTPTKGPGLLVFTGLVSAVRHKVFMQSPAAPLLSLAYRRTMGRRGKNPLRPNRRPSARS